jgi:hypothetical protein
VSGCLCVRVVVFPLLVFGEVFSVQFYNLFCVLWCCFIVSCVMRVNWFLHISHRRFCYFLLLVLRLGVFLCLLALLLVYVLLFSI